MSYYTAFLFENGGDKLHCTHYYLGDLSEIELNQIRALLEIFFDTTPFTEFDLNFKYPDLFGPMQDLRVWTCRPTEVPHRYMDLRNQLSRFRVDDYGDYRPHLTHESGGVYCVNRYALMRRGEIIDCYSKTNYFQVLPFFG